MAVLLVPDDSEPWPTLGPQVCAFLEAKCVHGPGDLKGEPFTLDNEARALLYSAYEVYPRGHPKAGRRRFKRVGWSLRKGAAKTEKAAAVGFAELHPEGPVRCDGWDASGNPVGRPVTDPYLAMVAFTEEQTEDLAYAALRVMCEESPDSHMFDVGLDRILRLDARGRPDGKAAALAGAPGSRDGARTTWQHFDETHRMILARLIQAHATMMQNLHKRVIADPWSLETTTTFDPGEESVAKSTHELAEQINIGTALDPTIFYFHRFAATGKDEDLSDPETRKSLVREASGPAIMGWEGAEHQVEDIAQSYVELAAKGNGAYWERVWLNRRVQGVRKAFDMESWNATVTPTRPVQRAQIALGLDGSRWHDATAVVATHIATGFQWVAGLWEDTGHDDWEVPVDEVEAAIDDLFRRYRVTRLYGDPAAGWDRVLASLAGKHGPKRVVKFYTDSRNIRRAAMMCASYANAIASREISHPDDQRFAAHIGAALKRDTRMKDDRGAPMWVMEKERHDSPHKIDAAMAGALSWKARLDTIAAGEKRPDVSAPPLDVAAHTRPSTSAISTPPRW